MEEVEQRIQLRNFLTCAEGKDISYDNVAANGDEEGNMRSGAK